MAKNYTQKEKDKNQREQLWSKRWEKTRTVGMLKYVVINGLLMWGILTSAIFQILSMYSSGFHYTNYTAQLISPTISLMIAGVMFGVSTWLSSENKYNKIVTNGGRYVDKSKKKIKK